MPSLHVDLSKEIEKAIEERMEETGQTKSEITRTALVRELGL